jgi:hypothetical protein
VRDLEVDTRLDGLETVPEYVLVFSDCGGEAAWSARRGDAATPTQTRAMADSTTRAAEDPRQMVVLAEVFRMVITIFFFFIALLAAATFGAPGLGAAGILLLLFIPVFAIWWVAVAVTTRRVPSQALARTKRHRLLGPGGPDDPFADIPYEDERQAWPDDQGPGEEPATTSP